MLFAGVDEIVSRVARGTGGVVRTSEVLCEWLVGVRDGLDHEAEEGGGRQEERALLRVFVRSDDGDSARQGLSPALKLVAGPIVCTMYGIPEARVLPIRSKECRYRQSRVEITLSEPPS
jgi:hypothetical protein